MSHVANVEQSEYWNGDAGRRWTNGQVALDRALEPFGRAVLQRAAPRPGERAVDIGCGSGATTLLLAEAVGPSGSAVGIDLSHPMLELARGRGQALPQLSFQAADAALFRAEAPFDLAVSRFGVMFFSDPVAAFANIRRLLRPDGRLSFVCWRAIEENPWMIVPLRAAAALLPPAPPADPDAPGPAAFARAARVEEILRRAGFADLTIEPFDSDVVLAGPEGGLEESLGFTLALGPTARVLSGVDDATRARVADAVRAALAPYVSETGVRLKGAVWCVSARAPRES